MTWQEVLAGIGKPATAERIADAYKTIQRKQSEAARINSEILEVKHYIKRELPKMEYSEFLKTQYWQELRNRIVRNAGNCCAKCGKQGEIQVHHLTYERRGNELEEDLIALCTECHTKEHSK